MQFARSLRQLAAVPSRIAAPVARDIRKDVDVYFDAGQGPYRRPWAELAPATIAKGRFHPPLTDTRKGRRGIKVRPGKGAGIEITSSTRYMVYHMRRTPDRPARKFLPEGPVPKAWADAYRKHLARLTKGAIG